MPKGEPDDLARQSDKADFSRSVEKWQKRHHGGCNLLVRIRGRTKVMAGKSRETFS